MAGSVQTALQRLLRRLLFFGQGAACCSACVVFVCPFCLPFAVVCRFKRLEMCPAGLCLLVCSMMRYHGSGAIQARRTDERCGRVSLRCIHGAISHGALCRCKRQEAKRQHSADQPELSGNTAFSPRNDRPYGLKRCTFQTEQAPGWRPASCGCLAVVRVSAA